MPWANQQNPAHLDEFIETTTEPGRARPITMSLNNGYNMFEFLI
jgi:hypothetical protein